MDRRKRRPPPRRRTLPLAPPEMVKNALPLEKRHRKSLWDVHAPGYEGISAEQLKLSGEIAPGVPLPAQVPAKLLQILSLPELIPEQSVAIRTIYSSGDPQQVSEYLNKFGAVETLDGHYVLPTPEAAARALASSPPFDLRRPPRVVSSLQGDIYSNTNTWYGTRGDVAADEVVELNGGRLYLNPQSTDGLMPLYDRQFGQPMLSKQLDRMVKQASDKAPAPASNSLIIFNAVAHTDPAAAPGVCRELEARCKTYGDIVSIKFVSPKNVLSRVEVDFSSFEACTRALDGLGGLEFDGRPLICAYK